MRLFVLGIFFVIFSTVFVSIYSRILVLLFSVENSSPILDSRNKQKAGKWGKYLITELWFLKRYSGKIDLNVE